MIERIKVYKVRIIIVALWVFAVATTRILYYLLDFSGVLDTYGYLDGAFLCIEQGEHVISSGLSFAYTNALVRMINLFHFETSFMFWWQLILETLALLLILLGSIEFWGFKSAMYSVSLMSVAPVLIEHTRIASPEEYFLFYFSVLFFILGLFCRYTRTHHWTARTSNELIVLFLGIYQGMLIAWNFMGFLSLFIFLVIVIKNYRIFKDKSKLQFLAEGEVEDQKKIMSVKGQTILYVFGGLIGFFVSLLKYTGFTGYGISKQLSWWANNLTAKSDRIMDFSISAASWIILSIFLGYLIERLLSVRTKNETNKEMIENEKQREAFIMDEKAFVDRDNLKPGESSEYFVTEDGRKVHYLENPLPLPKRHKEKGDKRFDLEKIEEENRIAIIDFDPGIVSISESEGMKKAKEGIEKVVKLPKYIYRATMEEALDILGDVPNKPSVPEKSRFDDFDYDTDDNDDFDI